MEIASKTCKYPVMIAYRAPGTEDAAALSELGAASFVEAFGALYSAKNLNLFLNQVYSPDAIAVEMNSPNRLFLIAQDGDQMVGYCKLGLDISLDYDPGGRRAMELKQLYLRQSHVGIGISQHLMDWAIGEARSRGFDEIILSVYSDNPRAQRFYQKYGFAHIANTYFMVGDHRDDEYLYRLSLTD